MKAQLILENGMVFDGSAFGHIKEAIGEVIFNTSMVGYQEIITDPSNYGNILMMTYPLIGNYGLNLDDMQADGPRIKALIVREKADHPSNWRNEISLADYLKEHRILGLEGIDTRALTKALRSEGSMKAIISVRELSRGQIEHHFKTFNKSNAVEQVSTKEKYTIEGKGPHVGVIDLGIKKDILDSLKKRNFKISVYPYRITAEELMDEKLDGLLISNGPGNPKDLEGLIEEIKTVLGKLPILGLGLGNEVLALSLGGQVHKMKYGHRGSNLPVKDMESKRIIISTQNHGYIISVDDLPENLEITHRNINDNTIEGIENKDLRAFGVEFEPEDSIYDKFTNYMEGK